MFSFAMYFFEVDLEILSNIRYNTDYSYETIYICSNSIITQVSPHFCSLYINIFFYLNVSKYYLENHRVGLFLSSISFRENFVAYYIHITCKMNNQLHTLYLLLVAKRHFIQTLGCLSNLKTNISKS